MFSFYQRAESRERQFDDLPVSPRIRRVFAYFHNLNLLALINDLRAGRVARQTWQGDDGLCPIAHGMPTGGRVKALATKGQADWGDGGFRFAARFLGAHHWDVTSFVEEWDIDGMSSEFLLAQLETLWRERLDDAVAAQHVIQGMGVDESTNNPLTKW